MKVRITHLKAPWPPGAQVGDVLDLPAVPAWAAGKCAPAGDADETLSVMRTPEGGDTVTGDASGESLPEVAPVERESAGWGKRKAKR